MFHRLMVKCSGGPRITNLGIPDGNSTESSLQIQIVQSTQVLFKIHESQLNRQEYKQDIKNLQLYFHFAKLHLLKAFDNIVVLNLQEEITFNECN
jgi:hypothetical protein